MFGEIDLLFYEARAPNEAEHVDLLRKFVKLRRSNAVIYDKLPCNTRTATQSFVHNFIVYLIIFVP